MAEEQKQMVDVAKKFVREEIIPKASHYDKTAEFHWDVIKKARSLGFMNSLVRERYGGQELSVLSSCLITEVIAYGCTGISLAILNNALGSAPVHQFGNEQQKKEYLGRLIAETLICAYGVTEPETGSDVAGVKTKAEKSKDGDWVLNRQKVWNTGGSVANWYFILARTNPDPKAKLNDAFTGFIVDGDSTGFIHGRKEMNMGQRCSNTAGITFENVVVPKKSVVGEEGKGFKMAMAASDTTRPAVAASAVGLAQRAFDEAIKYSIERKTFGVPIASHQAIQLMLAEMAMGIETSRVAYLRSAWMYDRGERNTYWASIAKCLAADVANKTSTDAVQIFGAVGFNSKYPVKKLMRDAKVFQIYEGSAQIQRMIIAREHLTNAKVNL